jgi:hypothetical protein
MNVLWVCGILICETICMVVYVQFLDPLAVADPGTDDSLGENTV